MPELEENMATWNDVKLWMTSQNMSFIDQGEYIDTSFMYTDTNRSQWLRISHTPIDDGTDSITVLSHIAIYNPLKTESLLLAAFAGVGGVAIQDANDGNRYFVLQTTVPLADLDASEIAFYIKIMAIRADVLEGQIFRVDNM